MPQGIRVVAAQEVAPYSQNLKNIETHLLDTGHFALETHGEEIANRIKNFLTNQQRKAA